MEDSFRVRVDKAFGNLSSNTTSSLGGNPSLWCLTDEEIEKREWNRNKELAEEEEEIIESDPSVVRNHIDSDLNELSDDDEEEEEEEVEEEGEEIDREDKKRRRSSSGSADASVDEYFDVQSNIGRDCTLDYEVFGFY